MRIIKLQKVSTFIIAVATLVLVHGCADENKAPGARALTVTDGMEASGVLGWDDFTHGFDLESATFGAINPPTGSSMNFPEGVVYDPGHHTLFVADGGNNRILIFLDFDPTCLFDGREADRVLGQSDFHGFDADAENADAGCVTATNACGLDRPIGLAYDPIENRLWVADTNNNRILAWDLPADHADLENDAPADHVIGQKTFVTNNRDGDCTTGETGTTNACGLYSPYSVSVGENQLMVADTGNERVTFYDACSVVTDGDPAVGVIGKADLTSQHLETTQSGIGAPCDVQYDIDRDRLYVADCGNNRVMVWTPFHPASFSDGAAADAVIGQPDFTTNTVNTACGGGSSGSVNACGLNLQYGFVAFNAADHQLFVSDSNNSRVLVFDDETFSNGEAATGVLGEPDLATGVDPYDSGSYAPDQTNMLAPEAMASAGDQLFVVDDFNHRVLVYGGE